MRHFLQSGDWANFQKVQGKKIFEQSGKNWSFMAVLESSSSRLLKSKRLYIPYGPTAKNSKGLKEALDRLQEIAGKYSAAYLRLEPMEHFSEKDLKSLGLIKAERTIQPPQTWQLNLKQPKENILKNMSSTNRNLYNTSDKKGIKFEITYDKKKLKIFLEMIHDMADRTGMKPHSDSYFKLMAESLFENKSAGLVFGHHKGKPIVSALFFDDKKAGIRYYAHAGSFSSSRKLQANSPLLTYLIMDAKEKDMRIFDFYGVAPADDHNHSWTGFSKFKRSFGGYEKKFSGTWELPVNKLNYKILVGSRKLAGKIKR